MPSTSVPPSTTTPAWADWTDLVRRAPELNTLLNDIRTARRRGKLPRNVWYGPFGIRARIEMTLRRALRSGATLPHDAELIALDRLVAELIASRGSRR